VPELELAAGIGFDGNIAIDQATGEVGAFRASQANAAGRAFSQGTLLAHPALEPLLAVATLAGHLRGGIPAAFARILGCQPDLVGLILFLGGLVNGAFLTIHAAIRPMSHRASFH